VLNPCGNWKNSTLAAVENKFDGADGRGQTGGRGVLDGGRRGGAKRGGGGCQTGGRGGARRAGGCQMGGVGWKGVRTKGKGETGSCAHAVCWVLWCFIPFLISGVVCAKLIIMFG
jgi:hypothetical protein